MVIGSDNLSFKKEIYTNLLVQITKQTCLELSPRSQMFIIIIFITITQQHEQDRWAENQPTAGLSNLNEYENEYENGMRRSETELMEFSAR